MEANRSMEIFANQYAKYIIESSIMRLEKEKAMANMDIGDTKFAVEKSFWNTPTILQDMCETNNGDLDKADKTGRNFEAGDTFFDHGPRKLKGHEIEENLQLSFDEDLDVSVGCFVQNVIDTAKLQVEQEMTKTQYRENLCEPAEVHERKEEETACEEERAKFFAMIRNNECAKLRKALETQEKFESSLTEKDDAVFMQLGSEQDLDVSVGFFVQNVIDKAKLQVEQEMTKTQDKENLYKPAAVHGRKEEEDTADEAERAKFFAVIRNDERIKLRKALDTQKKFENSLTEEDVAVFMKVDLKSEIKKGISATDTKIIDSGECYRANDSIKEAFSGTDVQYLQRTETSQTEFYHFYNDPQDAGFNEFSQEMNENKTRRTNKHDECKKPKDHSKLGLFQRILHTISNILRKNPKKAREGKRTKYTDNLVGSQVHLEHTGTDQDNQTGVTESLSDFQNDMTDDEVDFNCDDIEEPPKPTLQPFFTKEQTVVILSQPEIELVPINERKEKRRFRALTCCFRSS